MAKYNILENKRLDDLDSIFEERSKSEKETDESQAEEEKSEIQSVTDVYESSRQDEPLDESLFSVSPGKEAVSETVPEEQPPEFPEKSYTDELEKEKPVTIQKDTETEFADEKQEGINYKPIIIGLSVVFVIIAAVLIVNKFVLSSSDDQVPVVEKNAQPQQTLKTERDLQKARFVSQLNADKQQRVGFISALKSVKASNNVRYSSILLYGKNLNFEIFGSSRDDLAKYNMQLKNNTTFRNSNLIAVDTRPGKNGGIFGLFSAEIKPAQTAGTTTQSPAASIGSPTNWLQQAAQSNKLTVRGSRQLDTRKENLFTVTRMEYSFRGSENACLAFLNQMAESNLNAAIYKLTMIPMDQQNFQSSRYMLELVVDIYV